MNPHADLAADLPPPNPDEPASLRQDIVDELADHLACAARQEALRAELDTDGETPDEQTIAERVLARFGDPRRIARRLWFDAMKGRLMMQKLTAAFAAVAAIGAIAGCVLLWTALDATRSTLAEAIAENRKDRQASDEANRAVLAQLAKLQADAKKPPRSLEWNPLKFKLVKGKKGGPPAVGYSVDLQGQPYKDMNDLISKKTDPTGTADFGLVRPGGYTAWITTPWNSRKSIRVQIGPGSETEKMVVCPSEKVLTTNVRLRVKLPADLSMRGCFVALRIRSPYQVLNGQWWNLGAFGSASWFVLSGNQPARIDERWNLISISNALRQSSKRDDPFLGQVIIPVRTARSRQSNEEWKWVTATYAATDIALLMPQGSSITPSAAIGGEMDPVLLVDYVEFGGRPNYSQTVSIEKMPTFSPATAANEAVIWNVELPPKMIENARKRLKEWDQDTDMQFSRKLLPTGTSFDALTMAQKWNYVRQIRYYFTLMDANKDGRLQESEWNASKRIKPAFEKAKIDLTKDMSERDFVLHYIKLFPPGIQKQPANQPGKRRRSRRE
jgi:HAAS